jgi:hypothetical protein
MRTREVIMAEIEKLREGVDALEKSEREQFESDKEFGYLESDVEFEQIRRSNGTLVLMPIIEARVALLSAEVALRGQV